MKKSVQWLSKWLNYLSGLGFVLSVLTFWLLPSNVRSEGLTWFYVAFSVSCAVLLVVLNRRFFVTWPGFLMLVAGSMAAHLWLWFRWSLWDSPHLLIHNVNSVVGLLAVDLLAAVLTGIVQMLILRDRSPTFMAVAWLTLPLIMVGVALMYPNAEALSQPKNLRGLALWFAPLMMFQATCCLGPIAFLVHLTLALVKEVRGN